MLSWRVMLYRGGITLDNEEIYMYHVETSDILLPCCAQGMAASVDAYGSLPEQSVRAVHEMAIAVRSGTRSALGTFPDSFVPDRGTTYFSGIHPAPERQGEAPSLHPPCQPLSTDNPT